MQELIFLNENTTENKIINFYSLSNIILEHVKTVESFAVNRLYYKIVNNAKIKKIENLISELELHIEAEKIKLDFDKLNGCIIFEISKKDRKILYFEELKDEQKEGLTASIGKDTNNNEIDINLTEAPHLLIGGSTGSGKSCILNNIIMSLIRKYNKDYFKAILIDIKQVEFLQFANIPQLATPVITDTEKAIDILNKMVVIMSNRFSILSKKGYRNIQEYNNNEAEKMCYYLIVVDELADLFMQSPDIELVLCRLAQLGRAAGIHLILATQRPDHQTISSKLKVNIPTRIGLTVTNHYDSKIILDQSGAEKLTGKGDFILKKSNGDIIRGQGALIKDINKLLEGVNNG